LIVDAAGMTSWPLSVFDVAAVGVECGSRKHAWILYSER
jgi:hypothetical protein